VFLLRSCRDTVFDSRDRPCLLYQIRRCSGPCVERISKEDYADLVRQAKQFLSGETPSIQKNLAREMEEAAERLEFERAAALRDRIRGLTHVQGRDRINMEGSATPTWWRCTSSRADLRAGVLLPRRPQQRQPAVLPEPHQGPGHAGAGARRLPGPALRRPAAAPDRAGQPRAAGMRLLAEALTIKAGRRVQIHRPQRGDKRAAVEHAATNAREALERRMAEGTAQEALLQGTAALFDLPAAPERIEVYDNSHIQGANAYGVMVVAGPSASSRPPTANSPSAATSGPATTSP
jgi:excinuclease ABC subunit C